MSGRGVVFAREAIQTDLAVRAKVGDDVVDGSQLREFIEVLGGSVPSLYRGGVGPMTTEGVRHTWWRN